MGSWNRVALGGIIAAVSVGLSGGCVEPDSVGGVRAAVHGGTPSTFSGVGMMGCGPSGSFTGGVFLTRRHFMFLGSEEPCSAEGTAVFLGSPGEGVPYRVISNHEIPDVLGGGGGSSVALVISVLTDEVDISPALLASTSPVVDDGLTVVGYGAGTYDERQRTQGAFRVSAVDAADVGGATFTFEPVADARLCVGDSTVLDDAGELVGLGAYGAMDPDVDGCFATTTALDLAPHRAWIDEILALPLPGPPTTDSGAGDAGTSGDASTEPPPTTDDGGCSVGARGGRGEPLAVLFAAAVLTWWRRRG